jgi:hypothetical protein
MADEKYQLKDMLSDKLCPHCNSQVILIWIKNKREFECTGCKKKLGDMPYPRIEKPEFLRNKKQ